MCCRTQRRACSDHFEIAALHAFLEQCKRLSVLGCQLSEGGAMVLLVERDRIDFSSRVQDDNGHGRWLSERGKKLAMQMVPQRQARKQ